MLRHPKISGRSCADCRLHVYNEKTGERELFRKLPILRNPKQKLPCERFDSEGNSKCPKGHYSSPCELSPKNREAYVHYLTCEAVGSFPDDEIVRRNARIIRQIVDQIKEIRQREYLLSLMQIGVGRV